MIAVWFLFGLLVIAFAILVPLNFVVYPEQRHKRPWRGAYAQAFILVMMAIWLSWIALPSDGTYSLEVVARVFSVTGLYVLAGRYAQIARQLKGELLTQLEIDQPASES